jgi:lysophospholipase L1-like esterase
MVRPWQTNTVALATMLAIVLGVHQAGAARHCGGKHWLGVWATSPSDATGATFADQSLRLVINPTYGGSRMRVKLSNRFGLQPVTFGAGAIGRRLGDADVVPRSSRVLRFKGRASVTIPPGGEVVSDQRRFKVRAFEDLVVSLYVTASGPATEHFTAIQTSYATPAGGGDHVADEAGTAFTQKLGSWPFLTDLELRAPRAIGSVVTVGDSITDGYPGPLDGNGRYPDLLARRLAAAGVRLAIQNAGISGNRVLRDGLIPGFGPNLLDRLALDVIDQAGASVAIVLEGTNDLGQPPMATAADVIAGLQTVVERLHAAGFRVLLGTQTPSKDTSSGMGSGSIESIAARNAINDWIRTAGVADGVVDFHAAVRDPLDPDQYRPDFDSGDHLHPSPAGYQAMADAIDLALLADPPCSIETGRGGRSTTQSLPGLHLQYESGPPH